jgi:hypothetical protein
LVVVVQAVVQIMLEVGVLVVTEHHHLFLFQAQKLQ